jgi:tetratricopeptide (TPR) repeat protein
VLSACLTATFSQAQDDLLTNAIGEYEQASSKLLEYQEIALDWTMDGKLQVYLNEGINSLLEHNPSLAETNLSKLLQLDSSIWQAYYYRGVSNKMLGRLDLAEADFSRLIRRNQAPYESQIELGKIRLIQQEPRMAEKSFEKAIRINPSQPWAYYFKANIRFHQFLHKDAGKLLQTCLQQDSLFHDARIKLAIIEMLEKGLPEKGIPHLNRVLRLDSLNRFGLLFRSIATFTSDRTSSLADLNKLVRVNPNNTFAYYLRGLQRSSLEDYARAFPDFHKVIEAIAEDDNRFIGRQTWVDKRIDIQNVGAYAVTRVYGLPDADAVKVKKAYCLLVMGSYSESIATINATAIAKSEPLCWYLKAVANEHNVKHNAALSCYDRALDLDNDILDAHKKRGIYRQELKAWKGSIEDLTEVLRINPETFVVHKIRGVSYYYDNDLPKAIADFSRYLQRDSLNKEIMGYRAMAFLGNGQYLDASVDFARSGHADVLDFKKLSHSIDSVLATGDTLLAIHYASALTQSVPRFTEGYLVVVKHYVKRGEWARIDPIVDIAISNSRAGVSRKDHSFLLTAKAMMLCQWKRYENAFQTFEEAISYDRSNALAFLERGKLWMTTGKTNKAVVDLKRASLLGHQEATALLSSMNN